MNENPAKPLINLADLRTRGPKKVPEPTFKAPLFNDTQAPALPTYEPERFIQLGIEEIEPYAHNPRTQRNTQYDELKEALSSGGIEGVVLLVTRKPGDIKYHIQAGGNTRLKIIKELWEETGDKRFRAVRCVIKPYESEESTSAKHIAENLHRDDLCFWDLASGVMRLRRRMEESTGQLSQRAFIEQTTALGLKLGQSGINYFEFALARFEQYQFKIKLSRNMIEKIQPLWNRFERLATLAGVDIKPALHIALTGLEDEWMDVYCDVEQLITHAKLAVAGVLHLSAIELEQALELVAKDQSVKDWNSLKSRIRMTPVKLGPKAKPDTGASNSRPASNAAKAPADVDRQIGLPFDETDPSQNLIRPMIAVRADLRIPREGEITEAAAFEHCYQMAYAFACNIGHQKFLKRYARGVGWWMEPYVLAFRDVPDPGYRAELDAWSMLAMLSGQYERAVWETLPEDSVWVSVMRRTADKATLSAAAVVEPCQTTFARWFFGRCTFGTQDNSFNDLAKHPTGHDMLPHVFHAVHALLRVAPRRFAHINPEGTPRKEFVGAQP